MVLLFVYLGIAIFVSFLCSILEAVLLSVTPSYVESLPEEKAELKRKFQKLKKDIDKPLAAILSLNTIAHTVGAAGVGAQATIIFGEESMGIVSAILTLLILFLSEIIPKTIGANYWRSLTGFTASALQILIILMYPLVILAQGTTRILSRNKNESSISRAEVSAMADIGHQEGVLRERESKMIKSLIKFRSIRVQNIMTPRPVMVMADENISLSKLQEIPSFAKFSRVPVYNQQRDNVTGYIHKHDVLTKLVDNQQDLPLKDVKRKILIVPENMDLPDVFEKLIQKREHIALVVDEYGSRAGLVTMEDIMETLLGMEIMDEFDSEKDMQAYAREQWRSRAIKLGLIDDEENATIREETIKYGITGNKAPDNPDVR